jgi:hypothetical protein
VIRFYHSGALACSDAIVSTIASEESAARVFAGRHSQSFTARVVEITGVPAASKGYNLAARNTAHTCSRTPALFRSILHGCSSVMSHNILVQINSAVLSVAGKKKAESL